jgi:hypothetical protein
LRSACLKYLGLATPRYKYGHANLVGCPRCLTFRGRCALVALPAYPGHPGFYVGNEGLTMGCAPNAPVKYLRILGCFQFETFLRSASLQGLLEVGPARLLAAMLGDLGVYTLRLIKTMTQFSSLFGASNQPSCLLQCSGTTLRVRFRRPLVFLVVPTCWETCFSSHRYATYVFFSSFLDHHTGHPARHDAWILLYECIFDAL